MFLIDAYAWIEYFRGSKKGKKVAEIVDDSKTEILTLESTLAEIKGWALREGERFDELYFVIRHDSRIVHSTLDEWLRAAELRFEIKKKKPRFGMMDALLIAAKEKYKCMILTGDPHFESIKDVLFID